jgi:hypothetical protein
MSSTDDIFYADENDTQVAVKRALDRIQMTFEELALEAEEGHFSSEKACLTWMAISDLREYA